MTILLTADQHFGHKNIIEYCGRPFESATAMDHTLIENWNRVTGRFDTVFCLSDFTFGNLSAFRRYIARLNGDIIILGNPWHHDARWIEEAPLWKIENDIPMALGRQKMRVVRDTPTATGGKVYLAPPMVVISSPYYRVGSHNKLVATLSHFPIAEWPRKHYGAVHFHGHSHGNHSREDERIMDVGVDMNFFTPVKLSIAIENMRGIHVEEANIEKKR